MATINDLPPEILRMVFELLDQQPLGQDKITRIVPQVFRRKLTVRWMVRCEMVQPSDEINISVFETMRVCHAWQRIILDLLFGNISVTWRDENCEGRMKKVRSFERHYRAEHEPWGLRSMSTRTLEH